MDPVGFLDTEDPRYFNRYSYVANDPINFLDPNGEEIIKNGRANIVIAAGGSGTAALGTLGASGSIAAGVQVSFGLPGSKGSPLLPVLGALSPTIQYEGTALLTSTTTDVGGLILDSDVIEGGIYLGDFEDVAATEGTIEADYGGLGIEFTAGERGNNSLAGGGIKVGVGPGAGLAASLSETKVDIVHERVED